LAIPRIDENLICSKDVDETSHWSICSVDWKHFKLI
jgi:hypothetical protein